MRHRGPAAYHRDVHTLPRPHRQPAAWGITAGLIGFIVLVSSVSGTDSRGMTALLVGGMAVGLGSVVAWALARARAARTQYEDALTQWAAANAVQAERLAIARELHDLASHGLGMITVRAAAARYTAANPAGAGEDPQAALADIETIARQATTELRRMVQVLRSPDQAAPLQPTATLADLPALVAAVAVGGVDAHLQLTAADNIGPDLAPTVCALVREGLANVVRHAAPTTATVTVDATGPHVRLTITDAGPAPGRTAQPVGPGAGQGLAGARERATAVGGSLQAGPCGPGWQLEASLPRQVTP